MASGTSLVRQLPCRARKNRVGQRDAKFPVSRLLNLSLLGEGSTYPAHAGCRSLRVDRYYSRHTPCAGYVVSRPVNGYELVHNFSDFQSETPSPQLSTLFPPLSPLLSLICLYVRHNIHPGTARFQEEKVSHFRPGLLASLRWWGRMIGMN
jgi:hypothetical protein